ncbi:30S ribosomal protein S16 [Mycoplasmoides fastidiosum]|nr:30S ribosomal protein S16 [Mycoplasmoides fastidiosum]
MLLKIRLTRFGRKKLPFYRVVVTDSRNRRDGAYLELLGTYDPMKDKVSLKEEAILKHLNNGAQPTDVVRSLLSKNGIWKTFKDGKIAN